MTRECQNPKPESCGGSSFRHWEFGILSSFGLRHSSFLSTAPCRQRQPAQRGEVDRIPRVAVVALLRRFEQHRHFAEAAVADQEAKGFESEVPLADVGM